jgi:exopolyphosphatase/guanosine-5'-triphosphate,3'-diphosphate pyrophosphatase
MTDLAYNTIIERTHKILAEFEEKYHILEDIKNQKIQVLGTSGTVTVLGAIHLNLTRYNRSAVDGLALSAQDVDKTISKIKRMGDEGRKKHACIGMQKADLTIAGCAIIEGLMSFWNVSEITIADRGIREGILLDLMHSERYERQNKKKFRRRYPFVKKTRKYYNNNCKSKEAAND